MAIEGASLTDIAGVTNRICVRGVNPFPLCSLPEADSGDSSHACDLGYPPQKRGVVLVFWWNCSGMISTPTRRNRTRLRLLKSPTEEDSDAESNPRGINIAITTQTPQLLSPPHQIRGWQGQGVVGRVEPLQRHRGLSFPQGPETRLSGTLETLACRVCT